MKKIFTLCVLMFMTDSYAATVGLTWYDNGATIDGASSCTVGGTFTPPTPPARTGYVFAGWDVKEIHLSCDGQIQQLDTTIRGITYGYINSNGSKSGELNYGLSVYGTWATKFSYGAVWGRVLCNNRAGTYAKASATTSSAGGNCWCQVTGFSASSNDYTSGPQCSTTSSSLWVYWGGLGTTGSTTCASACAAKCADYIQKQETFRVAVYGAAGQ